MHKKHVRLLIALLAVFAFVAAACGDDDDDETGGTGTTATGCGDPGTGPADIGEVGGESGEAVNVGLAYDLGGRGDQSFNDAAARGLDAAVEDFGVEATELEPEAGGENREELLRLLAEEDSDLVVANGFLFTDAVTAAAADFPDTTFAIIDAVVEADNVASLVFAEEQGSFLVGAAAALVSETGKLGFVGGVETDLIKKFEAGFVAGAEQINPDIEIEVSYLTQPPDFSGFNDPAKGRESADAMYGNDADVVYHAAGGSGGGVFEAARENSNGDDDKVWAIGVDSDQYVQVDESLQGCILTSMLKRVDVAVYETITSVANDDTVGGITAFDLEADGVGYSTSGGFIEDHVDELEDLKEQIIDGEIEVPTTP